MPERKIRALLIDDSLVTRRSIIRILEETQLAEFVFTEAENGLDALDKFSPKEFDLIFVDMHMPKMDGFTFLNRIHSENTHYPPAVMITAETNNDRLLKVVNEGGAEAVLLKPVKVDRMRQGLKKLIDSMPISSGQYKVPHSECAVEAFKSTFKKACRLTLQPYAPESQITISGNEVYSVMYLSGGIDWLLQMGFNGKAAVAAASNLAGETLSFDSPDLLDAIGEVTNTVAGELKRLLLDRDLSVNRLALPTVMSANNIRFHRPEGSKVAADKIMYTATDGNASSGSEEDDLESTDTDPAIVWIGVTVGVQAGLMF